MIKPFYSQLTLIAHPLIYPYLRDSFPKKFTHPRLRFVISCSQYIYIQKCLVNEHV